MSLLPRPVLTSASLLLLAGCSSLPAPHLPDVSWPALPRPYTLEIQQGVVIEQKMANRLQAGMTRNQVSQALGTPLLTDVLHADRWDYVYYTRHQGELGEWRRFSCLFRDDRLVAVTGDVTLAPAGTTPAQPAADPATGQPSSGVPAPGPGAGPQPAGPAPAAAGPAR